MPRSKRIPDGCSLYKDSNGAGTVWRVRLGEKIVGKGRKPERRAFTDIVEAYAWIKEKTRPLEREEAEAAALGLTPQQVADVRVALARLNGRATLTDAVDSWLAHVLPVENSKTVSEAIVALNADQKAQGLTDRHCRETKAKLKRFFADMESVRLCDLTITDLEKARDAKDAHGKKASPELKVKRLRYASILMEFAIIKKWLAKDANPLEGVTRPKLKSKKISALSVQEVARLLLACKMVAPESMPFLAIKLFAGARNEELYELDWGAFRAETIRIEKTKTGRARSITIQPALRRWIESGTGLIFPVRPEIRDRESVWLEELARIEKESGVTVPQNALRHTFGSFHHGLKKDAGNTAYEMGNSQKVVKDHYADAVDDADTALFWDLAPENAGAIAKGKPEEKNEKIKPRTRSIIDY